MDPESPQSVAQAPPPGAGAPGPQVILAALNALLASLRLYGPDHPVALDAAASLSALVEHGGTGWVRVLGDGFTDASGARIQGTGLPDLARGLSAANVAAIGFFGPCAPGALVQASDALARLASRASTIHDEAARLGAATGDAVRILPLSAGRVALDSALCGGTTPVDWGRLLDQVFDGAAASLQSLHDQADAAPHSGHANPLVSIGEMLAHSPREERSGAMRQLRDRLAGLSPEQRGKLLDLEPGKPDSHYDSLVAVVEALPTSEVAAAIDGAVARTGAVSPHTIRILSKLIAVSRGDPQGHSAVQEVLERTRERAAKGSSPDPGVRAALETLLAAAGNDEFNPEAYDQTLRTLVRPDAAPPESVPLEWELPAAQACAVAEAIARGEDATPEDRTAHIEFTRRRLFELVEGRALDPIARALATTPADGPTLALRRDLAQPPALCALAQASDATRDSERIMRILGPGVGSLALNLAALPSNAGLAPRLASLAARSAPWPTVAEHAAALDPLAATDALAPGVGLDQAQQDALSAALLALGRAEITDKVMAVFAVHGLTWSSAAINHALASHDNGTIASALPQLVARQDPACLPLLGDYLCGTTPAPFSIRTYRLAARAMGASGELGLQALATVARALSARRGIGALGRLFLLGQTLERRRNCEPIAVLRRDPSVSRVRPILAAWTLIAWLREER